MSITTKSIFHADFQAKPFWWEAYEPSDHEPQEQPRDVPVAIIGGSYAGLAAALELQQHGITACVIEKENPGYGASTRSGGILGGCGSVKAPLLSFGESNREFSELISAARKGLDLVEGFIDREGIKCEWQKHGMFSAACATRHFQRAKEKAELMSQYGEINSTPISAENQQSYIGSEYYRGGVLFSNAGHLHPALYYEGLLKACKRRGISICSQTEVINLNRHRGGWKLSTSQGELTAQNVIVATNGYTGNVTPAFKRRVIPLKAYMIATEVLSDEMAVNLCPKNNAFVESARITAFFRLTGSKGNQRLVFGSRVKWSDVNSKEMAPLLHRLLLKRYPQLGDVQITHAWDGNVALTLDEQLHNGKMDGIHYALGCNGAGVANMTFLGTTVAQKIVAQSEQCSPFDTHFISSRFYRGDERWFIPVIGRYLQLRDWLDRCLDRP
ncbi:MAG: FAD-dependent oxidoreductase [Gammaproteobacteria bacterium]|nr:FAD-dependent oxidoreductase [Gammaproteobacteria bacterium]